MGVANVGVVNAQVANVRVAKAWVEIAKVERAVGAEAVRLSQRQWRAHQSLPSRERSLHRNVTVLAAVAGVATAAVAVVVQVVAHAAPETPDAASQLRYAFAPKTNGLVNDEPVLHCEVRGVAITASGRCRSRESRRSMQRCRSW